MIIIISSTSENLTLSLLQPLTYDMNAYDCISSLRKKITRLLNLEIHMYLINPELFGCFIVCASLMFFKNGQIKSVFFVLSYFWSFTENNNTQIQRKREKKNKKINNKSIHTPTDKSRSLLKEGKYSMLKCATHCSVWQ